MFVLLRHQTCFLLSTYVKQQSLSPHGVCDQGTSVLPEGICKGKLFAILLHDHGVSIDRSTVIYCLPRMSLRFWHTCTCCCFQSCLYNSVIGCQNICCQWSTVYASTLSRLTMKLLLSPKADMCEYMCRMLGSSSREKPMVLITRRPLRATTALSAGSGMRL